VKCIGPVKNESSAVGVDIAKIVNVADGFFIALIVNANSLTKEWT
jgi:hypothetical protein